MKNVMLGHSGVGKTTYVASVFGTMHDQREGFGLAMSNARDKERLLDLSTHIFDGAYPPLTAIRSEYDFKLTFENRNVYDFTWADYRGGALEDDVAASDTSALFRDLRTCDSVMVFCDARAALTNRRAVRQIGRMTNLIGEALGKITKPIPLVIVYTKIDLIDSQADHDRLLAPINGLVNAIRASDNVIGSVIGVSCGRECTHVTVPLLQVLRICIDMKARQLHAKCMACKDAEEQYEKRADKIAARYKELVSEAEYYARKAAEHPWQNLFGLRDDIERNNRAVEMANAAATQANSDYEDARDAARRARREFSELEPLIPPAMALNGLLSELNCF